MQKLFSKLFILFISLLSVSQAVAQSSVEVDLLLHTRQGEVKTYPLKNRTVITYSNGNLLMTTKDGTDTYAHSTVHKFTFKATESVIASTGIALDKTSAEMIEGETLTLTATVSPDNATDKTVVWTSSDESVATVADGIVSAKKAGKATIIATNGSNSATCEITVKTKVIASTGIALDKTTAEMTEGETLTLTATVSPDNATDKTVTWTSSDESVATVVDGVVSAKKAGKATIIATNGNNSAICEITVKAKTIAASSITLDKTSATIAEGETLTLTATVKPNDATDKTVTWTSSDEKVAMVINGVVIGVKAGKATIIATCGSQSATCVITVTSKTIAASSITLDKTSATITEGETLTLTATVKPDDATDKTVTWTSSDETVAKVINGVVIGVKAGKATIIATCGSQSATCEITVNAKVIAVSSISLDRSIAEMTEGEILTLTATVNPDNATDKTVTWTSSDESVATVVDGVVTALKAGKTTITVTSATNPAVSAMCEITVVSATGIAAIMATDGTVRADIYSTTGILVRKSGESLSGLKPGIYIVNGRKTIIR